MDKEIIPFNPRLKEAQRREFRLFCVRVKKAVQGKNQQESITILARLREEMNSRFGGGRFHANADMVFVVNLLVDLLLQDWQLKMRRNGVFLEMDIPVEKSELDVEKDKTRRRHLIARDMQLRTKSVSDFIRRMEKRHLTAKGWHSIFSVMRDGSALAQQLSAIDILPDESAKEPALRQIVQPYLQFVEAGKKCDQTGLLLNDIWRYFRHTWINEYQSLPGRSISILVRDAAFPHHPVVGIAALGSSVAQQACRDQWIRWEGKSFISTLKSNPSARMARWIIEQLDNLVGELYIADLLKDKVVTRSQLRRPGAEIIQKLKTRAVEYKARHFAHPHKSKFTRSNENMSWKERALTDLYISKRANALAELLHIRMVMNKYGFIRGTVKELKNAITASDFCAAVERLVRKVKALHVGINMMDIIVCGAVAPYNHLLGGKLVCMLLTGPEVVRYYNKKYGESISLIASSMSGRAVTRKPQLVALGTTSLYGAGSSQYNRIKIPAEAVGGIKGQKIEYRELGMSEGYGSFHFSSVTKKLADTVAGKVKGNVRVNSIFGEGANPLMRKLRMTLDHLDLDSEPILNHRNPRVVYGMALAENFGEVLLGLSSKAQYYIPDVHVEEKTRLISHFWIRRWLLNRIHNPEVLAKVARHSLAYPIHHGARVPQLADPNELVLFDVV